MPLKVGITLQPETYIAFRVLAKDKCSYNRAKRSQSSHLNPVGFDEYGLEHRFQ